MTAEMEMTETKTIGKTICGTCHKILKENNGTDKDNIDYCPPCMDLKLQAIKKMSRKVPWHHKPTKHNDF